MFLWPVHRFWTFTPLQWLVGLAWNVSEILRVRMPFAPQAFGIMIGAKPQRPTTQDMSGKEE